MHKSRVRLRDRGIEEYDKSFGRGRNSLYRRRRKRRVIEKTVYHRREGREDRDYQRKHEYSYALPDRMGVNPYDPCLTMQDIRELKREVNRVVAVYHGGKEHCQYPSPRLRNLCHEMILCGADAVLCQHSHCIGCYEEYQGGHIVYGQGNFHFMFGEMTRNWYTAFLVELDIGERIRVCFHPITRIG